MTTATTEPEAQEAAVAKKKTPPIKLAERQIGKQIKLISESALPEAQKEGLLDYIGEIEYLLQTIELVADPDNPPVAGSIHEIVQTAGKKRRNVGKSIDDVLLGRIAEGNSIADEAGF